MISKPVAYCPRCKSRMTVMDTVNIATHAEAVTYYCECDCGAANLTVSRGKITGIAYRDPIDMPDYFDEPLEPQE